MRINFHPPISFFITMIFVPVLFLAGCGPQEKAELLLYNATVYTVDEKFSVAEALVIHRGEIVEVGPEHVLRKKYDFEREQDLRGNFVYPGFIDAHAHFIGLAKTFQEVDLRNTEEADDIVQRAISFQSRHNVNVIRGRGWDQNLWEESEMPNNHSLSKAFPETPVLFKRVDGHAMLVNQIVLERNGITPETVIEGGEILLENGKCTGVLIDNAMSLVKWPEDDFSDLTQALGQAQRHCFSIGLTGLSELGIGYSEIELLDSLYSSDYLKIKMQVLASDDSLTFEKVLKRGGWMKKNMAVTGFKFYADGALGSRGACLLRPYSDDPKNSGFLLSNPLVLHQKAQRVRDAGMQLCTHAIGDSANRVVLGIYRDLLRDNDGLRWRIEHAQVVHDNDLVHFRGTGIIPSVQPTHGTSDMLWAVKRLGHDRIGDGYRYNELLQAAGMVAIGTDFPIEDPEPMGSFYAAVVRKNEKGIPPEGFQMENALSRQDAIRGMTIWAAYAQFMEHHTGSIEPGKHADLVVLDTDLLLAPEADLRKVEVLQTYVIGEKVYGTF
ncbi:MAG: amidohydrolase [Cryomorphaceae bacterium]|nr:amidohydrolase [Cryomorphaceae bacterium]